MLVLLCDTETNGLSFDEGACVLEVAAALFDTKHAAVVESYSSLIYDGKVDKNEAEHVNGIPIELVKAEGNVPFTVWNRFASMAQQATCIVAHRAEFDQGFVDKSIAAIAHDLAALRTDVDAEARAGLHIEQWAALGRPWVCTKSDFEWPNKLRGDSLVQLALGLGLGVASAHRAMADVDTTARCLTRVAEILHAREREEIEPCMVGTVDILEPLFRRAMRPKVRVVALVPFEQKDLAKQAGFFWEPSRREWYRMMPQEDIDKLNFRAVVRA